MHASQHRLQGQGAEAYSFGWYFPQKIQPGAGQADLFYKNNPFLSAAVQTQLGNNGTNPLQTTGTPARSRFQTRICCSLGIIRDQAAI